MSNSKTLKIAVLGGDGIGPEVTGVCLDVLETLLAPEASFSLRFEALEAGADLYARSGEALPDATLQKAGEADAILLGAMGLPHVRYPDGREIAPQLDFRERFELFGGIRPVKVVARGSCPLSHKRAGEIDLVLIRESTEGLFAGRKTGVIENDQTARNELRITRQGCERLFDLAFEIARARKAEGHPGRVTCVDKANVLQAFAFFRQIFDERAKLNPDIEADYCYIDAMALNLVRQPWAYDVVVTENMFGDILSDLGAGLMGGMGMAPSADLGASQAVFQPCHGSAPDIAGNGKANPTAMFLSAAMMLDWLGQQHDLPACRAAGRRLTAAVEAAFAEGRLQPHELGGGDGTAAITQAVLTQLAQLAVPASA